MTEKWRKTSYSVRAIASGGRRDPLRIRRQLLFPVTLPSACPRGTQQQVPQLHKPLAGVHGGLAAVFTPVPHTSKGFAK